MYEIESTLKVQNQYECLRDINCKHFPFVVIIGKCSVVCACVNESQAILITNALRKVNQ